MGNEYFFVVETHEHGVGSQRWKTKKSGVMRATDGRNAVEKILNKYDIGDDIMKKTGCVIALNKV